MKPLSETNEYLRDETQRKKMIKENVESSSAIEREELLFMGLDTGLYSSTAAIVNAKLELIAVERIYQSEDEYPRTPRVTAKKGERRHDPIMEKITVDHWNWADKIFSKYDPNLVGVESALWSMAPSNVSSLNDHVRGIIHANWIHQMCMIDGYQYMFKMLPPTTVKLCVAGNGRAKKKDIVDVIWEQYKDKLIELGVARTKTDIVKCDHISDSIAIAITLAKGEVGYVENEDDFLGGIF